MSPSAKFLLQFPSPTVQEDRSTQCAAAQSNAKLPADEGATAADSNASEHLGARAVPVAHKLAAGNLELP